jgi:5-oxoprolinase (ATP-hydrolysing) subunit A
MRIDLNADMGEGVGDDARLMPLVTSANVACGFHAGGPETMRRTVRLAREHGVAVGAHPGYPDRAGFGRRHLAASPDEVRDDVTYQIGALWAFCRAEGIRLTHVKPHGALYNAAAEDRELARAICQAARDVDPALTVVCLARSPMAEVARALGVPCAEEAFADRAYTARGTLVPRRSAGAVIRDPAEVAERVSRMVRERRVVAIDGSLVLIDAGTVCIHGDTPGAVELVSAIRARLAADGVAVQPLASPA